MRPLNTCFKKTHETMEAKAENIKNIKKIVMNNGYTKTL